MAPTPPPDEDEWPERVPQALSLRPDDIREHCVLLFIASLSRRVVMLEARGMLPRGGGFFCSACLIISGVVFMKADDV